jgi:hypothetical protein
MKKKRKRNNPREDPVERATELDRQWFAAHPGVNAYLRLLVPGEFKYHKPSSKDWSLCNRCGAEACFRLIHSGINVLDWAVSLSRNRRQASRQQHVRVWELHGT